MRRNPVLEFQTALAEFFDVRLAPQFKRHYSSAKRRTVADVVALSWPRRRVADANCASLYIIVHHCTPSPPFRALADLAKTLNEMISTMDNDAQSWTMMAIREATIAEATAPESKRDFASKMSKALKEAKESRTWLFLISKRGYFAESRLQPLLKEINEIIRILGAGVSTTRKRIVAETRPDDDGQ